MKSVNIKLLKVKVSKFMPKDGKVELSIMYSNDTVKEIVKTDSMVYPESLARRIFAEIRKTVKTAHQTFDEGAMVSKELNVFIYKEDEVTAKLARWLDQLRLNVDRVRNMKTADGYMDLVREVTKMEIRFD
ncbi:MAG: hypothetical protein V1837_00085 [Candidatus Woesearchaeota archaeon]